MHMLYIYIYIHIYCLKWSIRRVAVAERWSKLTSMLIAWLNRHAERLLHSLLLAAFSSQHWLSPVFSCHLLWHEVAIHPFFVLFFSFIDELLRGASDNRHTDLLKSSHTDVQLLMSLADCWLHAGPHFGGDFD